MKILPKSIKVEPGDLLGIKIRNASSPSTNDARPISPLMPLPSGSATDFEHQFSVAATIKPATTTPKPQLSTTGYLDVSHSSTRVETKKPPIDTTTLTSLQPTTSAPERKSDTSVDIPLAKDGTTSPGEDHIGGPSMPGLKTTQPAMDSITQQTNVMATTTLTPRPQATCACDGMQLIVVVIPVILVLTTIVILFVTIARMRFRKPGNEELGQDCNENNLAGDPYASIRPENTDSMAKGPGELRQNGPGLKVYPDIPLHANPDRVPNVRKVTYSQWISDIMPAVGLTGRHPTPVKSPGSVPGSPTEDGDDDGERYLKPISERPGFENPGCDVFAFQTDDPGQFMLPSGAIDSSVRPTRLPWGIPGDSPMTSQSSEDDQTYIDMNRYHYSLIPWRERSNGSDGRLAGNGGADRGPHTYLELLPDDDDVTGRRSKQAKYVVVLQTGAVSPVHMTVVGT